MRFVDSLAIHCIYEARISPARFRHSDAIGICDGIIYTGLSRIPSDLKCIRLSKYSINTIICNSPFANCACRM